MMTGNWEKRVALAKKVQDNLAELNRSIVTAQQLDVFTDIELKQISLSGTGTTMIVTANVTIPLSEG